MDDIEIKKVEELEVKLYEVLYKKWTAWGRECEFFPNKFINIRIRNIDAIMIEGLSLAPEEFNELMSCLPNNIEGFPKWIFPQVRQEVVGEVPLIGAEPNLKYSFEPVFVIHNCVIR